MLLYAGTTWYLKFNYFIYKKDIVKKLNWTSKSAGNVLFKDESSETTRNKIVENIKFISIHRPKHQKPLNDEQFGHYLAGLIDGDGHFNNAKQLVIVFSKPDAFLAYYIRGVVGYGNIRKVRDKNAYILVVSNKEGLIRVLNLINGKLRTESKFNQVINNILIHKLFWETRDILKFSWNQTKDFNNHWLAGFSDADASFQIKILERKNRKNLEVRLNYQIDQKKNDLLILIKNFIGGNIGYRKSQDTYYYGSTSFGSAKNVINYFDKFHLQSRKYVSYILWRKTYVLVQKRAHLTEEGINKITKIKALINRHDDTTI